MLGPGLDEAASTGGTIVSMGATQEVMSMEVQDAVPTVPRLARPKPTPMREVPKQKKPVLVCESPRKHAST